MPTEPNPSLDEQLKAYAQTRRRQAGEPFTLPPHTRRVLRAELERQFGQLVAARRAAPGWWAAFWPYVALGGSAAALLAVCAAIWWQERRPPEHELASATTAAKAQPSSPARRPALTEPERAEPPAEAARPEPAAAPPAAPLPVLAVKDKGPMAATIPLPTQAPAAATIPLPTQPPAAATILLPTQPPATAGMAPPAQPPAATAPAVPPSTTEWAMASGAKATRLAPAAPLSQRYQQQTAGRRLRRNLNSPPPLDVLNDFRLERDGNRVRITDADGSVYVGAFESAEAYGIAGPGSQGTPPNALATPAKQTAADKTMADSDRKATSLRARIEQAVEPGQQTAAGSQAGAEAGYWFNAIGTNRSLGQKVVVTGRLVATNALELMNQMTQNVAAGANVAGAVSNVQAQSLQQLLFNNFRVQGRVTVGGRTQMELNAVPTGQ